MTEPGQEAELRPRRRVGRFELFTEIASGGMATVHLGRVVGHSDFARVVAVKRLHPQYAKDPVFSRMFLDEARVVARIRHPNVLPTIDLIEGEGELFIVMEYVEGQTFAALMREARRRKERVPVGVALRITCGALHGLHAAHEATNERGEPMNLVHRDVSPDNIMVGADGFARLLDFGIARALGMYSQTREGEVKGKLAYMTPEQILGETITARTDVFAASVVLWQALTGRQLFKGKHIGEYTHKILHKAIDPPSYVLPDLPKKLDPLVLRGLEREGVKRWPSAQAMAEAIEEVGDLATQREVGVWVRRLAAEHLTLMARKVAAVENAPRNAPPRSLPPPSSDEVADEQTRETVEIVSPSSAPPANPAIPRPQSVRPAPLKSPSVGPTGTIIGSRSPDIGTKGPSISVRPPPPPKHARSKAGAKTDSIPPRPAPGDKPSEAAAKPVDAKPSAGKAETRPARPGKPTPVPRPGLPGAAEASPVPRPGVHRATEAAPVPTRASVEDAPAAVTAVSGGSGEMPSVPPPPPVPPPPSADADEAPSVPEPAPPDDEAEDEAELPTMVAEASDAAAAPSGAPAEPPSDDDEQPEPAAAAPLSPREPELVRRGLAPMTPGRRRKLIVAGVVALVALVGLAAWGFGTGGAGETPAGSSTATAALSAEPSTAVTAAAADAAGPTESATASAPPTSTSAETTTEPTAEPSGTTSEPAPTAKPAGTGKTAPSSTGHPKGKGKKGLYGRK